MKILCVFVFIPLVLFFAGCGENVDDDDNNSGDVPFQAGGLAIDFENGTNGNSIPHWILGFEFSVKESVTVGALGVWDDMFWNTSDYGFIVKPQQVGLWQSDGTLLASVFVSSSDPSTGGGTSGDYWGKWRFHNITPVVLSPGTNYIVASQGGEPMVYNPVNPVWDSRVTYKSSRAVDVGSGNPNDPLVFPSTGEGSGNPGYFGANFMIMDNDI